MFNNKNIFIALTYNCNAFCKKCMTRYHKNRIYEMPSYILNRILNLCKRNSYSGLISVGTGEPLLYNEIENFVGNFLDINDKIKLRLLTNGMLLSNDLKPILFDKRCIWGVTMDAFYQSSLNGLQKGVDIERVKQNVTNVIKKYGSSSLYLNFTVYNSNIDQIMPFCKFAVENGIKDIYLTELKVFSGFEKEVGKYKIVHDDEFYDIVKQAKEYLELNNISTKGIDIIQKNNRIECYKNDLASPIIDVNGNISFCSGREDIYVGNIMDEDIVEKWNSFKLKLICSNNAWCENCYDIPMENGIYNLPRTIKKGE